MPITGSLDLVRGSANVVRGTENYVRADGANFIGSRRLVGAFDERGMDQFFRGVALCALGLDSDSGCLFERRISAIADRQGGTGSEWFFERWLAQRIVVANTLQERRLAASRPTWGSR